MKTLLIAFLLLLSPLSWVHAQEEEPGETSVEEQNAPVPQCDCYCIMSIPTTGGLANAGEERNGSFTASTSVCPNLDLACVQSLCDEECKIDYPNVALGTPYATSSRCVEDYTPETVTFTEPPRKYLTPQLNIDIPGVSFSPVVEEDGVLYIKTLPEYIAGVYRYALGAAAIIAVVMVMVGGAQYIVGSSTGSVDAAKKRIENAMIGLVLVLGSYVLLSVINPRLTAFESLEIQYIEPEAFGFRVGALDTAAQGLDVQYRQMACPTQKELEDGVTFFTTGYYKPAYGEEGYGQNFACNIAMQCKCPLGPTGSKTCSNKNGTWAPCKEFTSDTKYCNKTTSGVEPVALHTAATSSCLPLGTVFKIFGSTVSGGDAATWKAEDTGGWIHGRRIDLFTGTGQAALTQAIGASAEVTVRVCPDNDETKCPTSP